MKSQSPFKFLAAYTREDADVFFGRERDTERLYEFATRNRLILVYGPSGTGKTSLVQCGLGSRFADSDWYPLLIRRYGNINDSLWTEIRKVLGEPVPDALPAALQRINVRTLRPVYLIFDQLEELLIMGSREEQTRFIDSIRELLASDLEVDYHALFIFREEFLAWLDDFEQIIPALFDRRLRVELLSRSRLTEVITRSCQAFNITLEDPEANSSQIIDVLSRQKTRFRASGEREAAGAAGQRRRPLALTHLQVYLDQLYNERFADAYPGRERRPGEYPPLRISTADIVSFGEIENVLERFLNQQTLEIQAALRETFKLPDGDDTVKKVLDDFVTKAGTKRPLRYRTADEQIFVEEQPPDYLNLTHLPAPLRTDCLRRLEASRILRFTDEVIELAHDALASLIESSRSDEERRINNLYNLLRSSYQAFRENRERGKATEHLTRKQLNDLEDYRQLLSSRLADEPDLRSFWDDSLDYRKREEQAREEEREQELAKERRLRAEAEKQRLIAIVVSVVAFLLFFVAGYYYLDSQDQREEVETSLSNLRTEQARTDSILYHDLVQRGKRLLRLGPPENAKELFDQAKILVDKHPDDKPFSGKRSEIDSLIREAQNQIGNQ